jgi:hypothetical protein
MMESIVHNLFSTEAGVVWLVLKWTLVVLAAGFIGQFGKAFATYLMRRARKPENPRASSPPGTSPEAALPPQRPAIRESFLAQPAAPPASPKDEKKETKALAKQQKKLLKKLLK